MVAFASEVLFLVIGALIGAYFQAGRQKLERLRKDICSEMADEITSAKISGDFNQEERLTKWTEVDSMVKRELPSGLSLEFSRYFQQSSDLQESKANISFIDKNISSSIGDHHKIVKLENGSLKLATNEYTDPETGDSCLQYQATFKEFYIEYRPKLREVTKDFSDDEPLDLGRFEDDIVRSHEPDNYKFQRIGKKWDSIHGNGWGILLAELFRIAEANEYYLHTFSLERSKAIIMESADEIDSWFEVIANTHLYVPYWLTLKKKLYDIHEEGPRDALIPDRESDQEQFSELSAKYFN